MRLNRRSLIHSGMAPESLAPHSRRERIGREWTGMDLESVCMHRHLGDGGRTATIVRSRRSRSASMHELRFSGGWL